MMAEYIKRETAVRAVMAAKWVDGSDGAMAMGIVASTPAADVAPVVHAEWVVCGDGDNVPWMCSHCGKTTAHKYKVMYGKYCPHCWAKMDGGDSE
jgi:hypothetical protein